MTNSLCFPCRYDWMSAAEAFHFFGEPGRKPPTSSRTAKPSPVDAAHRSVDHLLIVCLLVVTDATNSGGGSGILPRARRLDPFRLAGHLREVRRVRRLADSRGLLPLHPLEQSLEVAPR